MHKKLRRHWHQGPDTTISQNPGGGGGIKEPSPGAAPMGRLSRRQVVARAVDQVHPDAHPESMLGLLTPALTCARRCVHVRDHFPVRGF